MTTLPPPPPPPPPPKSFRSQALEAGFVPTRSGCWRVAPGFAVEAETVEQLQAARAAHYAARQQAA